MKPFRSYKEKHRKRKIGIITTHISKCIRVTVSDAYVEQAALVQAHQGSTRRVQTSPVASVCHQQHPAVIVRAPVAEYESLFFI